MSNVTCHPSPAFCMGNMAYRKRLQRQNMINATRVAPNLLETFSFCKILVTGTIENYLESSVEFFRESQLVNIESSVACISAKRPFSVVNRFPIMG